MYPCYVPNYVQLKIHRKQSWDLVTGDFCFSYYKNTQKTIQIMTQCLCGNNSTISCFENP